VVARTFHAAVPLSRFPPALGPFIGLLGRHDLRQVHAGEAWKRFGLRKRLLDVHLACHEAAVLRPVLAQDARELTRVDVGDADDLVLLQIGGEIALRAPVGKEPGQIAHHQPFGVRARRFLVLLVGARVADVRIGQRDDLAAVRGIGEDLLVPRHGGVEHHFAHRGAAGADRAAVKRRSVGEDQRGGFEVSHF
jgi:hypothetical protein